MADVQDLVQGQGAGRPAGSKDPDDQNHEELSCTGHIRILKYFGNMYQLRLTNSTSIAKRD
jgi:hypothetical protein